MLVKDETKYCWVDGVVVGEPKDSIKEAVQDYKGIRSNVACVRIGHPYYYVPEVDGERVIWNVCDYDLDDEIEEWSDYYLVGVKNEHIDELSEELTKVFQAWEKRHGYENRAYVVLESKTYKIADYIKE